MCKSVCGCCCGKDEKAKGYNKANYNDPNYEGEPVDDALKEGPD